MSSVRFTSDQLSTTTFPTQTGAYHWGGWLKVNAGGYSPANDSALFALGRSNFPIEGMIIVIDDVAATDVIVGIYANDFAVEDFQTVITGGNTNWFAWIFQYPGTGTAYTFRWRFENETTWHSVTLDCGAAFTNGQSIHIADDQYGEPAFDCNHKGIWCAAGTLSDAAALTASINARQGITPVASPLHWLDLDSATNCEVNGGSAGNWTIGGSPATDASEPTESGGGTTLDVDAGTDTAAVSDAIARSVIYGRSTSDSIALTDDAQWDLYKPADACSATDSVARSVSYGRSNSDSVSLTDSASSRLEFARVASDAIGTTDAVSRRLEFGRASSDSVSTSDSVSVARENGRAGSDTISTSDSTSTSTSYVRSNSDSISVTDSVTAQKVTPGILDVQVSDTLGITDSLARSTAYQRALSDSASTTDTTTREGFFGRLLADTCSTTDSTSRTATYARSASDTLSALDAIDVQISSSGLKTVSVSDSLSVADSLGTASSYVRAGSDSVAATDTTARALEFLRAASDACSFTDALARALSYGRVANDTVAVTDSVTVELIVPAVVLVTVSDSVGTSDALSTVTNYVRAKADTIAATDSISVELIRPGNPPTTPGRRGPVRDMRDETRWGPIKRFVGQLSEAA
jgi:hypothetical protein